jgi:recombination protein RecT
MADNRPALAAPDQRGGAPTQQERRPLEAYLASPKVLEGIRTVAGRFLNADRMLRILTFAVRKNPKLAACDPQSFLGAVMTSAALGLEPNTPQGHAYLIPYDKRGPLNDGSGRWGVVSTECQFIVGYRGFIELAYRNPNIVNFTCNAVHKNDYFDHMQGSESFLKFRPALENRGPLIGAYAYCKYRTLHGAEAEMSVVLPLDEIHKARSKSETFNFLTSSVERAQSAKEREKAEKKLAETPWVMWEDDMAAKTALRKLAKFVPLGDAFAAAAAMDERADGGTMDLTAMADPTVAKGVVDGEYDPPTIEHQPEETFEGPGQQQEQRETVERKTRTRQAKPKDEPPAQQQPIDQGQQQEQRREPEPESELTNGQFREEPPPAQEEWQGE